MTVQLQYRLKEIIERTPGCRVMGIGLEGGLATFITKDPGDAVPEQKMWRLMKQTIEDLGYTPGVHVAIALDPAASAAPGRLQHRTSTARRPRPGRSGKSACTSSGATPMRKS